MAEETDFKFDDKLRQQIHYDWGKYYKRLGKNESAKKQFLDSLSLKENAHGPMEQLSKCYLDRGDAAKALELASQCLKNHPKITREKYLRNECIYDSNEFETCLVERYKMCHDKKPIFGAIDAIKLTELTLEKSIGNHTGSFLNNFRSAISELDKIKAESVDTRPLWKIRRDKKECDVLSICSDSVELKKSETIDHPLDIDRFRRERKFLRSMYFSTPTIETHDFLKALTDDPRLNFPPATESTEMIRNAIKDELEVFKKFELMLQQRHPIYAKKIVRCKRNNKKFNELTLSRMQDSIEMKAKNQLEKIKKISETDFPRLLTFVEDIMTNFYLMKSVKVFPKKVEYLNTIYNIVGTCYIQKIQIPSADIPNNAFALSNAALSYQHHGFVIPKKFNIRPGFKNPNDHFLKRLHYSNIPIEKCYILHQLSRLYFKQEKYMESKEMGEELINISRSLNNYIWMLLGYLRVMLVDATIGELDNVIVNVEAVSKWKENVPEPIWNFLKKTVSTIGLIKKENK